MRFPRGCRRLALALPALLGLAGTGCLGHDSHFAVPEAPGSGLGPPANVPTELNMITLPPYAIGSPDVLLIDVLTEPKDVLGQPLPLLPQPIQGPHLVRPDGTVKLGVYGSVSVAGLTTEQAQEAIRRHVYAQLRTLNETFGGKTTPPPADPNRLLVSVDVAAYNSKRYYVITDGAGFGERVYSFPIQGHETVLEALASINGLPEVGSKKYVWVARRTPNCNQPEQILPVDYIGLTQHGITLTNYQILPGDRVYVRADAEFRIDGWLQKVLTPIERLFGVTLLGSSAVHEIQNKRTSGSGF
jgi:polysaccharide export outer membrane protein